MYARVYSRVLIGKYLSDEFEMYNWAKTRSCSVPTAVLILLQNIPTGQCKRLDLNGLNQVPTCIC